VRVDAVDADGHVGAKRLAAAREFEAEAEVEEIDAETVETIPYR